MEIKSKRITGTFVDVADGLKYEGSFQQDINEHLIQFNCAVSRINGEESTPLGDVYSFYRNQEVALNYNGFAASVIGQVATHCEALVSELDSADEIIYSEEDTPEEGGE